MKKLLFWFLFLTITLTTATANGQCFQRHSGVALSNAGGFAKPISGANVTIWSDSGCSASSLVMYSNNTCTTSLAQPVVADINGNYGFYTIDNKFYEKVTGVGLTSSCLPVTPAVNTSNAGPIVGSSVTTDPLCLGLGANKTCLTSGTPGSAHTVTVPNDIDGHVPLMERNNVWTATQNFAAITSSAIQGKTLNKTFFYPDQYGALHDGAHDDTAAIQAAIDACQAMVTPNIYGGGEVVLSGGNYSFTSQLSWKSCALIGTGPNSGTRLTWNGAAGVTAMVKTSDPGGGSFGELSGIEFVNGTAKPATWLSFNTLVDQQMHLHDLQFQGSTGDAIAVPNGWVNLQWDHLRFDNIGGYTIKSTVLALQNQSSWSINHFTVDSSGATPPGIFGFDNTAAASVTASTVSISDARIESSGAWAANSGLVVELTSNGAFQTNISDITIAIPASGSSYLYYSTEATGTFFPELQVSNVLEQGLAGYVNAAGGVSLGSVLPPVATGRMLNFHVGQFSSENISWFMPLAAITFDGSADALRVRERADVNQRFKVKGDGSLNWGDGTNATDTSLTRNGVNSLSTTASVGVGHLSASVGVTQGGGLKHQRWTGVLGGGCPTLAAVGAKCASAKKSWTTAFADTNYTINCTLSGVVGQPTIVEVQAKDADGVTIAISALTAVAADVGATGQLDCIAMHD